VADGNSHITHGGAGGGGATGAGANGTGVTAGAGGAGYDVSVYWRVITI
jgi:hypothetical protein